MKKSRLGIILMTMNLAAYAAIAQVADGDRQKLLDAAPSLPAVVPKQVRTLLIFQKTSGWTPPQRALVDTAMGILGRKTGAWKIGLVTEDPTVMTPESLAKYDAILMNNCNELTLTESQSKALQDFVKGGKGVLGMGSTISIRNWPEESEMWGGFCYRHPLKGVIPLRNEDPAHPLTMVFGADGTALDDTWYVIYSPTSWSRDKYRVLLSWNWPAGAGPATDDFSYPWTATGDYPISYIRTYGKGRVYFNDFMHLKASPIFESEVLSHLVSVTQWAMGDLALEPSQSRPGPEVAPRPFTGATRVDASKVPALLTQIKAGTARAVFDLAKALPDARAESVFPDIVKMIATVTGSWYVSQDAAIGVGRMGEHGKGLVPLLTARLNDPNPMVRTKIMYAFEEMGPSAAEAIPVLKAGLSDKDWLVRQGAAQALGNIGAAAVPAYLEMLRSEAWFTRFQGAQGLGKAGRSLQDPAAAVAALTAALGDPDPEVANAANRALGRLGVPVTAFRGNPAGPARSIDQRSGAGGGILFPSGSSYPADAALGLLYGLDGRRSGRLGGEGFRNPETRLIAPAVVRSSGDAKPETRR